MKLQAAEWHNGPCFYAGDATALRTRCGGHFTAAVEHRRRVMSTLFLSLRKSERSYSPRAGLRGGEFTAAANRAHPEDGKRGHEQATDRGVHRTAQRRGNPGPGGWE